MLTPLARMNDYVAIKVQDEYDAATRRLLPQDTLRIHRLSLQFLVETLSTPFDGITLVMTHHAPSARSVPTAYKSDPLMPCYASALDHLIEEYQPALWVHGHLHQSADYVIGRTRILCNPRGYHPAGLNPHFDPALTVEVL